MADTPVVSIIIVSFNHLGVLLDTLASVLEQAPSCEVVLVDNNSSEPVADTVKSRFPSVEVVRNSRNGGFGQGCNIGARHARGEFLVFVNSDVRMLDNPIPSMLELLNRDESVGMVGCRLFNADGSRQPSAFRLPGLAMRFLQLSGLKTLLLALLPRLREIDDEVFEAGFVSGAFFLIRRSFFLEIGGFDERYFMYLEDADLGFQVRRHGKRNIVYNRGRVVHLGQHYEDLSLPAVFQHMNRGYLLFVRKNFMPWKFYAVVLMSLLLFSARLGIAGLRPGRRAERAEVRKVVGLYWSTLLHGDLPRE